MTTDTTITLDVDYTVLGLSPTDDFDITDLSQEMTVIPGHTGWSEVDDTVFLPITTPYGPITLRVTITTPNTHDSFDLTDWAPLGDCPFPLGPELYATSLTTDLPDPIHVLTLPTGHYNLTLHGHKDNDPDDIDTPDHYWLHLTPQ